MMKNIGKALILSTSIFAGAAAYVNSTGNLQAEASSITSISKTSFQTTANLNIRMSANLKAKLIVTVPKGKIVTATQRIGTWYKISYTYKSGGKNVTKSGWASGNYLNGVKVPISPVYLFTNKTSKLYSSPDTKKKEVYSVASNTGFYSKIKVVNSAGQTWYQISYKGKTLYVNSSYTAKKTASSFSQTKYTAEKDTYIYQSYGSSYTKIIKVPKSAIVTSKSKVGDWYAVSYGGKSGYTMSADLAKYNEVTFKLIDTDETYYFSKSSIKLYSAPDSTKQPVLSSGANEGFVSKKEAVNSLGETWYSVEMNGKNYYVKNSDVTSEAFIPVSASKFKLTAASSLYVLFGPQYKVLANVPKDTIVTPDKKIGSWYHVSFEGQSGYISESELAPYTDYTEQKITQTTFVTTSELNIRGSADAASGLLSVIPASTLVAADYKTSNGWYKVAYDGKIGYVSGSYLKQVVTGDPLTSHDSYQFIDLRTKSNVTAAQINGYIAKNLKAGQVSVLTNKGQSFIDAGNRYGVNALYLAAHAIHESDFGRSNISLGKNNLFGFGAFDISPFVASYRFSTIDLCINYIAAEIKSTYLNKANWKYSGAYLGFSTKDMKNTRINQNSEGMNFYYASDPNWGKSIARHMENMLPYDKAYYKNAVINPTVPGQPGIPGGSDVFPAGITAVAKQDLVLNSAKGVNDKVKTIKSGSSFNLLEKTNDYWVRVSVNNVEYWINTIKFDKYKNYLAVQNLGRITGASSVNIRKDATVSSDILGSYKLNNYVSIVPQKDGTATMNSTKTWYKVQLSDGTFAWVSATYVARELQ